MPASPGAESISVFKAAAFEVMNHLLDDLIITHHKRMRYFHFDVIVHTFKAGVLD